MTLRKRPSARLVLLDGQGRVLLFRYAYEAGPLAGVAFWATPGGSLDPGESFLAAARRELLEETGLCDPIGPEIGVRLTQFAMPDGEMVEAEERYFLVRCSGIVAYDANPDPVERAAIAEARWWRAEEIASTAQTIYPETLAEMMLRAPSG